MTLAVREMTGSEVDIIIDYFQNATPEHLETLGVDPTRLPAAESLARAAPPINARSRSSKRSMVMLVWLLGDRRIGFSTADKIHYGEQANMHLHVIEPERRQRGVGAECVRRSVDIYFQQLGLKRLYCEPNAFNVAPNRTLQKAGFKYLKTHMTVPVRSISTRRSPAG